LLKKETDGWDISVCGLNCAKCEILLAGQGDEKSMENLLGFFKDLKPENIVCGGCRGPLDRHWSADCKFLACTKRKGLTYCFECTEFPCGDLKAFASDGPPHHRKTVENMKLMKEIGIESWLKEQKKSGRCVFCP